MTPVGQWALALPCPPQTCPVSAAPEGAQLGSTLLKAQRSLRILAQGTEMDPENAGATSGQWSPSLEQPELWTLSRAVCPIHGLNHAQLSLLEKGNYNLMVALLPCPGAGPAHLPSEAAASPGPANTFPAPVVYLEESGISRDASWISQQSQRHPDCPALLGSPRRASSSLAPTRSPPSCQTHLLPRYPGVPGPF